MFPFCCRLLFLKRIVFTESSVGIDEWYGSLSLQYLCNRVGLRWTLTLSTSGHAEWEERFYQNVSCIPLLYMRDKIMVTIPKGLRLIIWDGTGEGKKRWSTAGGSFVSGWVVLVLFFPNISFALLQWNVLLRNWVMFSFNKLTYFLNNSPVPIWSLNVLFLFPLAHIPDACVLFWFY